MTGSIKHKTHILGAIAATGILLAFCQLTTNFFSLSFSGVVQLIIVSTTCILCFLISEKQKKIFTFPTTEQLIILLLLLSITVSLFNTSHLEESAKRVIAITATTIFAFSATCFSIKPKELLQGFSIGIIAVTTTSILYSITAAVYDFNFINLSPYETVKISVSDLELFQNIAHRAYENGGTSYYIQRYSGIFPNPNGLGLMSAIGFGLSYCLESKKCKFLFQLICLTGLVLSVSRMGMLLFLTTLIYYHLQSDTFRRLVSFAMIVGLFAFLLVTASSSDFQSTEVASASQHELLQLRERGQMLALAWQGFQEHWLLGVGYGVGAEHLFGDNADIQAVHSVFLNALLETGIVGAILLILIWLLPIFTTKSGKKDNARPDHQRHVISAVLFGIFFAQAFDLSVTRFHYIHVIIFLLFGLWSALGRKLKDMATINAQSPETQRNIPKHLESSER